MSMCVLMYDVALRYVFDTKIAQNISTSKTIQTNSNYSLNCYSMSQAKQSLFYLGMCMGEGASKGMQNVRCLIDFTCFSTFRSEQR